MKLIITEKQFKKLILKENKESDLKLLSEFCSLWEELTDVSKNNFLKDKENLTSYGLPLDPSMFCQLPLTVEWITDKERKLLKKLLKKLL
jgi:hypothetical protein